MRSAKPIVAFFPGLIGALVWLSAPPAEAGENLWTSHGPVGVVQHLGAASTDPLTVYAAGTANYEVGPSIFRSLDGGESWETLSPGDLSFSELRCLAVDPTQPMAVYAGISGYRDSLSGGVFLKSSDGGTHWESRSIGTSQHPYSIGVDAWTGTIYLGTNGGFDYPKVPAPVLKSTDGGSTWGDTALARPRGIYALLVGASNGTVLAGTDFGYFDPTGFGTVGFGGNVARTVDGGENWSLSPIDLGSPVLSLAKNSPGSVYYAGTEDGALYESVDGGANWALLATLPGAVSALAVDLANSSVLYAATPNRGVLRSTDGGATWWSFNAGMASRSASALTVDATGRVLHAATKEGVFDLAIAPPPPSDPCAPGADHLCLFGSRFRVDLTAVDPFTKRAFAAHAVPGDNRSGYFTFPSLTGDPMFPEVAVKMVDATSLPGAGYWFFYAGLTNVLYTLKLTDTTTGLSREYSGEDFCGGADTLGFLPGGLLEAGSVRAAFEAPRFASFSDPLLLLNGRFLITLAARHPATDREVSGLAILRDDRFGAFSLPDVTGDPRLPEVFVKMIDATGGSFLFFHAGLTHLDYAITVFDTVTETENTYMTENADIRRPCGTSRLLMFPQ